MEYIYDMACQKPLDPFVCLCSTIEQLTMYTSIKCECTQYEGGGDAAVLILYRLLIVEFFPFSSHMVVSP
jgi:hypothetical protein